MMRSLTALKFLQTVLSVPNSSACCNNSVRRSAPTTQPLPPQPNLIVTVSAGQSAGDSMTAQVLLAKATWRKQRHPTNEKVFSRVTQRLKQLHQDVKLAGEGGLTNTKRTTPSRHITAGHELPKGGVALWPLNFRGPNQT